MQGVFVGSIVTYRHSCGPSLFCPNRCNQRWALKIRGTQVAVKARDELALGEKGR